MPEALHSRVLKRQGSLLKQQCCSKQQQRWLSNYAFGSGSAAAAQQQGIHVKGIGRGNAAWAGRMLALICTAQCSGCEAAAAANHSPCD
jgi:hypothetical protein